MKTLRAYADTSVFGGAFDDEFKNTSLAFFDLVRAGRFVLLVSDISRREIDEAPVHVMELFDSLSAQMEFVVADQSVLTLRDAYIEAGIVGARWLDDAAHVAAASVAGADLIISWNFRHIVHFEKIRLYNAVNTLQGYKSVEIRSPLEVVDYED